MRSIKVIAPIEDLSGYGEVSRRYIRAFVRAGLQVSIQVASSVGTKVPTVDYEDLKGLVGHSIDYDSVITFLEPDEACEYLRTETCTKRIVYYNPKAVEIYEPWRLFLSHYATELWVPGSYSKEFLENPRLFTIPVREAPTLLLPEERAGKGKLTLKAPPGSNPITDKTLIFYTIGRWNEHRNFAELVECFFAAFTAKDDVCLVIKTYGQDSNDVGFVGESLKKVRDYGKFTSIPSVLILNDVWPRKYLAALHRTGHVYVSTSRYEGASINIHDALAIGNRVIFPKLGDTYESPYFTPPVPTTFRPVRGMPRTGYVPSLFWGQPDLNILIDQMQGAMQHHFLENILEVAVSQKAQVSEDVHTHFKETEIVGKLIG